MLPLKNYSWMTYMLIYAHDFHVLNAGTFFSTGEITLKESCKIGICLITIKHKKARNVWTDIVT